MILYKISRLFLSLHIAADCRLLLPRSSFRRLGVTWRSFISLATCHVRCVLPGADRDASFLATICRDLLYFIL